MIFTGVDLAAQPAKTAICQIEVRGGNLGPLKFFPAATDQQIIDAAKASKVTAIDAPLGFPEKFEEAMKTYVNGGPWPESPNDLDKKEICTSSLQLRSTEQDLMVRESSDAPARRALSSSASFLTVTTWRALRLLAAITRDGYSPECRTGGGESCVIEVYPAASIRAWGREPLAKRKTTSADRGVLLNAIVAQSDLLKELAGEYRNKIIKTDHAFDSFCACLTAIAFEAGYCRKPEKLTREGWIYVPEKGTLASSIKAVVSGP